MKLARSPEFRRDYFGVFSSHPDSRGRQLLLGRLLLGIPAVLVLLAGLGFGAFSLDGFLRLIGSFERWAIGILAALAFFYGGVATLTLVTCWSEAQEQWWKRAGAEGANLRKLGLLRISRWLCGQGRPDLDEAIRVLDPLVLMAVFVVTALLPVVLASLEIGPQVRLLAHFSAVMPYVVLSIALRRGAKGGRGTVRRRRWLLNLLVLFGSAFALTLVHDLAEQFDRTEVAAMLRDIIPWYADLGRRFLGCATLLPMALLIFVLWRLLPVPDSEVRPRPRESRLRSAIDWIRRLFGRGGREKAAPEGGPEKEQVAPLGPPWLQEIRKGPEDGWIVSRMEVPVSEGGTASGQIARPDIGLLFGGMDPTRDQFRAFEAFAELGAQSLGVDGDSGLAHGSDLLLHGESGSGRSLTLRACCLHSVLARGRRSLVVVPDEVRQSQWRADLSTTLKRAALEDKVTVAELNTQSVSMWIERPAPPPEDNPDRHDWLHGRPETEPGSEWPDVIVGTTGQIEKLLYGQHLGGMKSKLLNLRSLLLTLDSWFVEDVCDFDPAERVHLPFLVGKHRLLLAHAAVPFQVTVAAQTLTEHGVDNVVERFFDRPELCRRSLQVQRLHGRPIEEAWVVDLPSSEEVSAVTACLAKGLGVRFYRKGISVQEGEDLTDSLLREGGSTGGLEVVTDTDQGCIDAVAVFCGRFGDEATVKELAARACKGAVVFRCGSGDRRSAEVTPVFADRRSAEATVAAHCASLAPLLPARTIVEERLWTACGIDFDECMDLPQGWEGVSYLRLEWDDPDVALEGGRILWPGVSARCEGQPAIVPIDTRRVSGSPFSVFRDVSDSAVLHVGTVRPTAAERRAEGEGGAGTSWDEDAGLLSPPAFWYSGSGKERLLGIDLPHFTGFRTRIGGTMVSCEPPQLDPTSGELRLFVRRFRGDGGDLVHPRMSVDWTFVAEGASFEHVGASGDLAWGRFEFLGGVRVRCVWTGRFGADAREVEPLVPPIWYGYRASLSFVLTGVNAASLSPERLQTLAMLTNSWGTSNDRFLGEETARWDVALGRFVPDLHFFARSFAFNIQGLPQSPAARVVWIIEPITTGRALSAVVFRMLGDRQARERLLAAAGLARAEIQAEAPDWPAAGVIYCRDPDFGTRGKSDSTPQEGHRISRTTKGNGSGQKGNGGTGNLALTGL